MNQQIVKHTIESWYPHFEVLAISKTGSYVLLGEKETYCGSQYITSCVMFKITPDTFGKSFGFMGTKLCELIANDMESTEFRLACFSVFEPFRNR